MAGGVRVVDRDNGYRGVFASVRKLSRRRELRVGVNDAIHVGRHGAMSNAQLGAIHEFGLGVPQRSFLRAWVDQNETSWMGKMKELLYRAVFGDDAWAEKFGRYAVEGVRARMRAGIAPALAADTVKRKATKNPTPLLDTEQLINAVEFDVGEAP